MSGRFTIGYKIDEHIAHVEITEDQARFIADQIPASDSARDDWERIADALESANWEDED